MVINYSREHAANAFPMDDDSSADDTQSPLDPLSPIAREDSNSPTEDSSEKKGAKSRWKWNDEKLNALILCLYDYKAQKDFQGKDMESDLVRLYEDLRKMMATKFPPEDFGPEYVSNIPKDLTDLEKATLEKKQIKVGYNRIKYRVKILSQNFKKAVVDGTRSGSGKLIVENWDQLISTWGGCPSVKKIHGAVVSNLSSNFTEIEQESDSDSIDEVENLFHSEIEQGEVLLEKEPSAYPKKRKETQEDVVQPPKKMKLCDNKRKKLEKNLSTQQRDQIMVKVAKEELELKKKNAETLEKSIKGMEAMVETMAQSLNNLGQQLGSGLLLLAQAMTSNNQQYQTQPTHVHQGYPPHNQYHQPAQQQRYRGKGGFFRPMADSQSTMFEQYDDDEN